MRRGNAPATEGPCRGHVCDNCSICRRGRCCRRDRPDYHLPEEGSWQGEIYGELGVLACDGEKVQCHICGAYFRYLANHTWRSHQVYADEYKAYFGLNASTGLVGPATRALQQQIAKDVFHDYWNHDTGKLLTSEERADFARRRKWRLEAKKNPRTHEIHAKLSRERYLRGEWQPPKSPPPGASAKGIARFKEHLKDPTFRVAFGKAISERQMKRVTVHCTICGKPIEVQQHQADPSHHRTCSKECFRELRRRYMREHLPMRQETKELVMRLRELPAEAFVHLSSPDREMVRFRYGLNNGQPSSLKQTSEYFGISVHYVRQILQRSVATVLSEKPAVEP